MVVLCLQGDGPMPARWWSYAPLNAILLHESVHNYKAFLLKMLYPCMPSFCLNCLSPPVLIIYIVSNNIFFLLPFPHLTSNRFFPLFMSPWPHQRRKRYCGSYILRSRCCTSMCLPPGLFFPKRTCTSSLASSS